MASSGGTAYIIGGVYCKLISSGDSTSSALSSNNAMLNTAKFKLSSGVLSEQYNRPFKGTYKYILVFK